MYECAVAGVPSMFNMVGLVLAGQAVQKFGTPEQKARHLRQTLTTEHVWCQLFSEPGAGSDLAGLSTRAERDGDNFVVNGQKVWCSGGRYSNWGILMARTDPDAKKHDGISFFLCPMDLPGIEVRPLKQMTGEAEFDEVFFTDVQLPADHLLGPLHGGWGVGMAVLTNERGHIGTSVIGLERRLESMSKLAEGRRLGAMERQRLMKLDQHRRGLQGDGPAPGTHRLDSRQLDETGHHRDDVRERDAARRPRRRGDDARRARGLRHVAGTGWAHRWRHQPGTEEYHR